MIAEANDFRDESLALHALISSRDPDWGAPTQFKGWTLNNVLRHLHFWNIAADLSLDDEPAFDDLLARMGRSAGSGRMTDVEAELLDGLSGAELLDAWRARLDPMTERFTAADPKQRLKWVGPTMSARSSITARLMETWAHGQEVYDAFGVVRENQDRIRSICVLGMNTFGWTFMNRKEAVPERVPYVRLTAPSGTVWEWNDPATDERIEGPAEDFCQVVTQVRNIADVSLDVTGAVAIRWMSIAQCFAGPPNDPPAPGTRFTAT